MACNSDMKKPQNACDDDDSKVNDILTEAVKEAIIKATAEDEGHLDLSLKGPPPPGPRRGCGGGACGKGASYGNISETRIADAASSATDFVLKIVSDAILVASSKIVVKQDTETTQEAGEMQVNNLTEIITEALNNTTNTKTSSTKSVMPCNSDMKKPQNTCEADDILTEAVKEAIIKATAETKVDLDVAGSETRIADAASSATDFVFKIIYDAISVASSKMVVKQDEPEKSKMKKRSHENDDTVDEPVAKKVCLETMSVFLIDIDRKTYFFKFNKKDIPLSVWVQLTALKAAGKTFFPQVGNSGYHVLLPKSQKRTDRLDLVKFFKQVISQHNWLNEFSQMDKISGCTFGICLVDE